LDFGKLFTKMGNSKRRAGLLRTKALPNAVDLELFGVLVCVDELVKVLVAVVVGRPLLEAEVGWVKRLTVIEGVVGNFVLEGEAGVKGLSHIVHTLFGIGFAGGKQYLPGMLGRF
jgi:hypothetical protein